MLTAIFVVSVIFPFPGQPCQLMTRLKGTDDLSHSLSVQHSSVHVWKQVK